MLRDTGRILRYQAGAENAYYNPSGESTYIPDVEPIAIAFEPGSTQEFSGTVLEITRLDGTIYLHRDATITSRDRILVTHINGRQLQAPITCACASEPKPSSSVQMIGFQTLVEHS